LPAAVADLMREKKNMSCDHRRLTCNGARRGGTHVIIVVGPPGLTASCIGHPILHSASFLLDELERGHLANSINDRVLVPNCPELLDGAILANISRVPGCPDMLPCTPTYLRDGEAAALPLLEGARHAGREPEEHSRTHGIANDASMSMPTKLIQ
jgi:hypothetical protein